MYNLLSDHLSAHKDLFFTHTMVGFLRQAAQWYPEKEAVRLKDAAMTFRMLDRSSDQLAHYLSEREHIGPGDLVAISAGRSAASIAIIFGIWKAGAAYVVTDPGCPESHNRHCLEAGHVRVSVDLDCLIAAINAYEDAKPFEDRSRPGLLALILYTSGTTGAPKGVRILHSNITASVSNFDTTTHLSSEDRFASFADLMFIASVYDLCSCMAVGCTMQLVPREIRTDIRKLAAFYTENGSTATFLPSHMAVKYMDEDEGSPLRLLLVGSEAVRNLKPRPYQIINVYASSETCSFAFHYTVTDSRPAYPIGKPVDTLQAYIMDDDGVPVKDGEEGELWLSGPQIFDGYANLPELNQTRFAPNPFETEPPYDRAFKTSDIARRLPDGDFMYLGRRDTMYKIRGFRVEATGIEVHLLSFPHITGACVTCFTDAGGTNILFGYYISDQPIDHKALRDHLGGVLPYYAVPTGLIRVEAFPRSPAGKVNRKGFAAPPELNDHKKLAQLYY